MNRLRLLVCLVALCGVTLVMGQRTETLLKTGWRFTRADNPAQCETAFDDSRWQAVKVPHDWAIAGPFDKEIDKQMVAIEQNGEKQATEKTGRSGSLPWIGTGWYRIKIDVDPATERALLNFDGAMAEPTVWVNGQKAGEWKYGYTPFMVDITPCLNRKGRENVVAVRLENHEESSRWYPGGGIYRPVKLITTSKAAIDEWGINVETVELNAAKGTATLHLSAEVNKAAKGYRISWSSSLGRQLSGKGASIYKTVRGITPWSPEHPQLYTLTAQLTNKDGQVVDIRTVKFGIRTIEVSPERGFCLNGQSRKIKGVCLHHDLGMLGAAVNRTALLRQLALLRSMGCDAIRTSHNMPSQMQMELCDSLGLMVMAESFDMWQYPKCKNGYARFFDQWHERDLTNLVRSNRLHPSIVMWSIGNEVPEQGMGTGLELTRRLQNIVHGLDHTRPVTMGMDRIEAAMGTGVAQVVDIPGMNYRTHLYEKAYKGLRHGFILGSETASTVSSRGVYKFPVEKVYGKTYADGQCSGYDTEYCSWSNLPEDDWLLQDDKPWVIGEFVWTGFDYLGEPTPYDEYWPSRSSYFGIFDLAGLPKDRYWLYRSRWNTAEPTLHLLPHWTWPGREGQVTPVYCYTSWPTAELFVNGVSQGRISKNPAAKDDRYRLRWNNVKYQPGELRVVAYDAEGHEVDEQTIRTAGKAHHLEAGADRLTLRADGEDMDFITVAVVDADDNLCPDADNEIRVSVKGAARFRGICNGDATSLEPFTQPHMRVFKGMLVVGIETLDKPGPIEVEVTAKGLKKAVVKLKSE